MPTPPAPLSPEPITLLITYDRVSGSLNLQGPIQDRVLTYGILGAAFEAVVKMGLEQGAASSTPRIAIPRPRIFSGR